MKVSNKRVQIKKMIVEMVKMLDSENDDYNQNMEDLRDLLNEAIEEKFTDGIKTFILKSDIEDAINELSRCV